MTDEAFYIGDDDRFGRFRLIGWWDQRRLEQARVLVVGAGALGNEVIKNLALMGIGNLLIIDLDEIEASNLSRSVLFRTKDRGRPKAVVAAEAARDLHPEINVQAVQGNITTALGLGVFRDADVVIGCLDNREARLWVNQCCWKVKTPWIDAGIQEINGVMKVFVPPDSSCYECGMTDNDYRLINLRYSCPLLKRDDILSGKVPTAPTISSILAGMQTQEALKLLHGMPVEAGVAQVFHGASSSFYKTAIQRRDDCLSHVDFDPIIELSLSARTTTANELFQQLDLALTATGDGSTRLDASDATETRPTLRLDRDLVTSIHWELTGETKSIMRPLADVGHREAESTHGGTGRPQMTHTIGRGDALATKTLSELGVPDYDIVTVVERGREHRVLLAGDRDCLAPFTGRASAG